MTHTINNPILLIILVYPILVYFLIKFLKDIVLIAITLFFITLIIYGLFGITAKVVITICIIIIIFSKFIKHKLFKKIYNYFNSHFKELNLLFLLIMIWCLLLISIIPQIFNMNDIAPFTNIIIPLDNQTISFVRDATGYVGNTNATENSNINSGISEITLIKNVGSVITIILSLTTLYMFNLINNTLNKYSLGVVNLILKRDGKIWGLLYFAFNIILVEILLMMFPSITIFIIVNLIIIAILIWRIRNISEYIKIKYYMDTLMDDIIERLEKQVKEDCKNHINHANKYYYNINLNDAITIFDNIKINERYYNSNNYNGEYKDINGYEFVLNDAFISLKDLIKKAVNDKDDTLLTLCGVVIHKVVNNDEIGEREQILKIICNIIILDILIPSYDDEWIYGIRIAWDLLNLDGIKNEFGKIVKQIKDEKSKEGTEKQNNNTNVDKIKELIKGYKKKVGLDNKGGNNGSEDT